MNFIDAKVITEDGLRWRRIAQMDCGRHPSRLFFMEIKKMLDKPDQKILTEEMEGLYLFKTGESDILRIPLGFHRFTTDEHEWKDSYWLRYAKEMAKNMYKPIYEYKKQIGDQLRIQHPFTPYIVVTSSSKCGYRKFYFRTLDIALAFVEWAKERTGSQRFEVFTENYVKLFDFDITKMDESFELEFA